MVGFEENTSDRFGNTTEESRGEKGQCELKRPE